MKKYKQKEWNIKKTEIINEINSVNDNKFNLGDFKSKIKRNIPSNCSNRELIIEALEDVKQGTTMIMNGRTILNGNKPKEHKVDLIDIIGLITLDREWIISKLIKKSISWFKEKIGWKWIVGIILSIIGILVKIYYK